MAVTIDVGEKWNIHPVNKQEVGHRLALAAQGRVYHKDVVSSGPVFQDIKLEGSSVRISFTHTDGGLVAAAGQEKLRGFVVAGVDLQFVPAEAIIDGDTVVVSCKEVRQPAAVRYAWADNPECNLFNKTGLPAAPFRTDAPAWNSK
jgi:sialate O-acetylesterase